MKRYIFFCVGVLFTFTVWAEGAPMFVTFPPGCQLIPDAAMVDGDVKIGQRTNNDGTRLVFVKNVGVHDLYLVGEDDLLTRLSIDNWSALVFSGAEFNVRCIEVKPGSEQYVSCAQVVRACEYHDVTFWQEDMMTEWLVDDTNLYDLIAHVTSHGIYLPTILPGNSG